MEEEYNYSSFFEKSRSETSFRDADFEQPLGR